MDQLCNGSIVKPVIRDGVAFTHELELQETPTGGWLWVHRWMKNGDGCDEFITYDLIDLKKWVARHYHKMYFEHPYLFINHILDNLIYHHYQGKE